MLLNPLLVIFFIGVEKCLESGDVFIPEEETIKVPVATSVTEDILEGIPNPDEDIVVLIKEN